jgi:hypothetical protein
VRSYSITDPYHTSAFKVLPLNKNLNHMQNFVEFLRGNGAASASLVQGPNGKFIRVTYKEGFTGKLTYPVGGNSQNGKLHEFGVFTCDDGGIIATVNEYVSVEQVTF